MVRMAAGVSQKTKRTTIAIKTTTSILSSGLWRPLLLVETRCGVPLAGEYVLPWNALLDAFEGALGLPELTEVLDCLKLVC